MFVLTHAFFLLEGFSQAVNRLSNLPQTSQRILILGQFKVVNIPKISDLENAIIIHISGAYTREPSIYLTLVYETVLSGKRVHFISAAVDFDGPAVGVVEGGRKPESSDENSDKEFHDQTVSVVGKTAWELHSQFT